MSMTDVDSMPSLVPERRRRSDVIDVDSLDDEEILNMQRPLQRRRLTSRALVPDSVEAIVISDSDDELSLLGSSASNSVAGPSRRQNRRPLFSPPPPPVNRSVPPVPSVPRHLSDQTSLPMRRHAPPFPTGVVRPNDRPFAFELDLQRNVTRARNNTPHTAPLTAAPPSHHNPPMGLGGALVAMNRQTVQAEHAARERQRERERSRRMFNVPLLDEATGYIARAWHIFSSAEVEQDDALLTIFEFGANPPNTDGFYNSDDRRILRRVDPEYKSIFTHPIKAVPGFTFDFAPPTTSTAVPSASHSVVSIDVSPEPVASASTSAPVEISHTTLVCARCLDPLVLGGLDSEEDRSRRRLWGLRCGHILDGKCVEEIMKPLTSLDTVVPDVKGKGRPSEDTASVEKDGEQTRAITIDKGKGKALDNFDVPPPTQSDRVDNIVPNSMRARLRPRHPPPEPTFSASSSPTDSPSRSTRPSPRRARDNGLLSPPRPKKGKGKAREPTVEAQHEWACPVSGCGHVHVSLCIGGKWTMDMNRGAITIYV